MQKLVYSTTVSKRHCNTNIQEYIPTKKSKEQIQKDKFLELDKKLFKPEFVNKIHDL